LRLPQTLLGLLSLGDIQECGDRTRGAALGVQKRDGIANDVGPASVRKRQFQIQVVNSLPGGGSLL
jgi:hypothetical protein